MGRLTVKLINAEFDTEQRNVIVKIKIGNTTQRSERVNKKKKNVAEFENLTWTFEKVGESDDIEVEVYSGKSVIGSSNFAMPKLFVKEEQKVTVPLDDGDSKLILMVTPSFGKKRGNVSSSKQKTGIPAKKPSDEIVEEKFKAIQALLNVSEEQAATMSTNAKWLMVTSNNELLNSTKSKGKSMNVLLSKLKAEGDIKTLKDISFEFAHQQTDWIRKWGKNGGVDALADLLHDLNNYKRKPKKDDVQKKVICIQAFLKYVTPSEGVRRVIASRNAVRTLCLYIADKTLPDESLMCLLNILTVICLFPPNGHAKMMEGMKYYQRKGNLKSMFEELVDILEHHPSGDMKSVVFTFISACTNGPTEKLNLRLKMRDELYGLGLKDIIEDIKDLIDQGEEDLPILEIQIDMFEDEEFHDDKHFQSVYKHVANEELDFNDPDQLFQNLMLAAQNKGLVTYFNDFLTALLSINPSEHLSKKKWSIVNDTVRQIVLEQDVHSELLDKEDLSDRNYLDLNTLLVQINQHEINPTLELRSTIDQLTKNESDLEKKERFINIEIEEIESELQGKEAHAESMNGAQNQIEELTTLLKEKKSQKAVLEADLESGKGKPTQSGSEGVDPAKMDELQNRLNALKLEKEQKQAEVEKLGDEPSVIGNAPPAPIIGGPPAPIIGGPPPPPIIGGGPPPPPMIGGGPPPPPIIGGGPPPPPMIGGGPPPPPMIGGGPPPPPGKGGPPPPGGPRGPPVVAPVPGSDKKPTCEGKVRQFNWTKMKPMQKNGTVFEKFGLKLDIDLDFDYIQTQFEEVKRGAKKDTEENDEPEKPKKVEIVSYLDPKTTQNLNIFIHKFKNYTNEQIADAILELSEEVFDATSVKSLIGFLEAISFDAIDAHYETGDESNLNKADIFCHAIGKVPNLESRLSAFKFFLEFDERLEEIAPKIEEMNEATNAVGDNPTLFKLLEVILHLGNFLNNGVKRLGDAFGFKIDTLAKLSGTKTIDNKNTILEVMIEILLDGKNPEVLELNPDDITRLEKGVRISLATTQADLASLQKEFSNVAGNLDTPANDGSPFYRKLDAFVNQHSEHLEHLNKSLEEAVENYKKTVASFKEDPEKTEMDDFFGKWLKFFNAVVSTKKGIIDARENAERDAKREEAKQARLAKKPVAGPPSGNAMAALFGEMQSGSFFANRRKNNS